MHYLRRAASQGHAAACFRLGALTQAGSAVPRDIEEAAVLFAQAAEQGHAEAQLRLGEMLEGGEGVAVDSAAAGRWYRLALRQPGPQQPVAANNLAELLVAEAVAVDPGTAAVSSRWRCGPFPPRAWRPWRRRKRRGRGRRPKETSGGRGPR